MLGDASQYAGMRPAPRRDGRLRRLAKGPRRGRSECPAGRADLVNGVGCRGRFVDSYRY
ncbi:protein of unknown function [Cupriavidus taiwanensis]|nr:protein of unknown function [Cupriavidus taiwanensis]